MTESVEWPEEVVERIGAAINEAARMPGYHDAPFTRKEARIFARAALKALGWERISALYKSESGDFVAAFPHHDNMYMQDALLIRLGGE